MKKISRLQLIIMLVVLSSIVIACGTNKPNKSSDKDDKSVSEKASNKGVRVKIKTTAGDMTILLYNETPLHKANFIKLVNEKFYDGILFHRVIKNFMIQAGDPDSKTASKDQMLGSGGPGYTINAEFNPKFIHKKGALSAARQGDNVNPEKKSAGSQFYIVQGKTYGDVELKQMEAQAEQQAFFPHVRKYLADNPKDMARVQKFQQEGNKQGMQTLIDSITNEIKVKQPNIVVAKYTDEQKNIYKTIGGTPFLDRNYTVFGEVIEGLEIIDKIAEVKTNAQDRPLEDVKIISMTILKK